MRENRVKIVINADGKQAINTVKKVAGGFTDLKDRVLSVHGAIIGMGSWLALDRINRAIEISSDLQEETSKFGVVFAGQMDIAEQWAETLVDKYLMSERESRKYLAAVQDLLVPMGMQADAAARMSNNIVKLTADLGSFNNQRTADVMADAQSALVGNYETMKKYGIVLNETVVKQKAMEMGLATEKKALTAAEKARAAYQLMLEGSAAAIGDMERTSSEHANTVKRLNSEWEDFAAILGEKFLPAATRIKGVTADILDNLTNAIKGPPIDEQILAAEQALNDLMHQQEVLEIEAEAKRMARMEARRQRMLKSFGGSNSPINSESQQILDEFNERQRFEMQMDPHALEIKRIKEYIAHLREVKNRRDKQANMGGNNGSSGSGVKYTYDIGPMDAHVGAYENYYAERLQWIEERERMVMERKADLAIEEGQQMLEIYQESQDRLVELSERTAWSMQENFSSFFFDSMAGELKSFESYATSIFNSIAKAWSDAMGQMVTQSVFGNNFDGGGLLSQLLGGMSGSVTGLPGAGDSLNGMNVTWSPRQDRNLVGRVLKYGRNNRSARQALGLR